VLSGYKSNMEIEIPLLSLTHSLVKETNINKFTQKYRISSMTQVKELLMKFDLAYKNFSEEMTLI
jgi:hypothetical protein